MRKSWLLFLAVLPAVAQASPPASFLSDLENFQQKSVTLRSDWQRLEAASTLTLSRLLQLTPAVSAGVGKSRDVLNGNRTSGSYDYWRAKADWNLFRAGGDYFSWRSASDSQAAQAAQVKGRELEVELAGGKLIFRRLYLHDVAGAQAELLRLKQEAMRIGNDRYKQGKIPLQEVVKMEVDLSQQQNVVRESEINIAENEAAYRTLFVDSLQTKEWPLAEQQSLALAEGPGSLLAKRRELEASAARANWRAAGARYWPSLDFSLVYQEFPLRKSRNREWTGTLELSIPLWSRFQTAAESAQAQAAFVQAEGEATQAKREEGEQRGLLEKKIALSQVNLREARQNLEKSDRLYQDMLRTFQMGRLSTNDLFQEQNRKIQSLLSYTQSRLSFHESVMEACALWGLSAVRCLQ